MSGFRSPLGKDTFEVSREALLVLKKLLRFRNLIVEGDAKPPVQVARRFQTLTDDIDIELCFRKDLGIGMKSNRRSATAATAELLEIADRLARLELHLVNVAIPFDRCDERG